MNNEHIKRSIAKYYSEKIKKYGSTPLGVDWNSEVGQIQRFAQLLKVINFPATSIDITCSICDIGCRYGKFFDYLLQNNYKNIKYIGYDLSEDMIKNAKNLYGHFSNSNFIKISDIEEIQKYDYVVASGIFNVKMKYTKEEWLEYIIQSLLKINAKSINGFSFNMLTKYSDEEYKRDDLYYADPLFIFDYCKKNFSKNIALLHDYDLYEFTILVKK